MKIRALILWAIFIFSYVSVCYGEIERFNGHIFKTEFGEIEIKNVKLEIDSFGTRDIYADVTNKTNKFIKYLTIKFYAYDNSGKQLIPQYGEDNYYDLFESDLKPGETKRIKSSVGISTKETRQPDVNNLNFIGYELSLPVIYRFSMLKPTLNKNMELSDSNIDIKFKMDDDRDKISFTLKNKTFEPIEIDWNKVSYVDPTKKSHKVIHSGVKYSEKEKQQTPTLIPPTSYIEDVILPSDSIHYHDTIKEWSLPELLPFAPKSNSYMRGGHYYTPSNMYFT